MKKFLALGYMVALPLLSGAKILPSIVALLLFSTTPSGVLDTFGLLALGINSTLFGYFVSGWFQAGTAANFIMGL